MPNSDVLGHLRADLDYEKLVESASPDLRRYITTLEQENARLRQELMDLRESTDRRRTVETRASRSEATAASIETVRRPDDVMVITITRQGVAKRTALNDYSAQHRGGTGVFDIHAGREDPVAHLLVGRANAHLLLFTTRGRAFRLAVDTLPLTEVRGRGVSLSERLLLTPDEAVGAVVVLEEEDATNTVLLATANGWVRSWHRNYVGPRLQPGTLLYDPPRGGGPPVAAALSDGEGDVLIALRSGLAYRFAESLVRREGVRGIQVRPEDRVVGLAAVREGGQVLLVTADGQGARRAVDTFAANKSPGGQGKIIVKSDSLVAVAAVGEDDDALCISGLAKIIRFPVAEVPVKAGSVQGVNVMDCRGDELVAVAIAPALKETP